LPRNLFRSLFTTPGPTVAVSIAPAHVTAVQIHDSRGETRVCGHARASLPAGAVTPAMQGTNLAEPSAVTAAIDEVLVRLPRRPRRIALLLPDDAAKVSIVRFATVPARATERNEMIRWQVRKTVPFNVDDAQMACGRGRQTSDGEQEFVVVLAQRAVVEEYEQVCAAAGTHAGRVEPLSVSLMYTALAHGAGDGGVDWLLVRMGSGSTTLAVVRGRHPLLFRTVATGSKALGDLVHQTVMYYEDRLGGSGLSCALVGGDATTSGGVGAIRRVISDRLSIPVEPVAGRVAPLVSERADVEPGALDELVAPLGVLLPQSVEAWT